MARGCRGRQCFSISGMTSSLKMVHRNETGGVCFRVDGKQIVLKDPLFKSLTISASSVYASASHTGLTKTSFDKFLY